MGYYAVNVKTFLQDMQNNGNQVTETERAMNRKRSFEATMTPSMTLSRSREECEPATKYRCVVA